MAADSAILPNPFTPLAFLPPNLAGQVETATYVFIGSFSAYAWDWLISIPEEIKMCRRGKFSMAVFAYFLSRIGTFTMCMLTVVLQTSSVPHCMPLIYAIGASTVISQPFSSALFFFRVKAVYCDNRFIVIIFGFLWLALFGFSLLVLVSFRGEHIGTTQRCIIVKVMDYASIPGAINFLFDTLVFIAISLRIMSFFHADDASTTRAGIFFRGDGLSKLPRALLQGGQLYYFATVILNLTTSAMVLAPVPPVFHTVLGIPNLALESAMACRVFRKLRIGTMTDFDAAAVCVDLSSLHIRKESSKHGALFDDMFISEVVMQDPV